MISPLIVSFIAMISVGLIMVGLVQVRKPDPVQARLAKYALPARNLEELELRQPFSVRIIKPLMSQISGFVLARTPLKTIETIEKNLVLAGNPNNLDVRDFLGIKGIVALILGGLALLVFAKSGALLNAILFTLPIGGIGFRLPDFWLKSKIKARKKEITKALPDALDLLTVCVGAGLGFDAALTKVTEKWDNALSFEFGRVLSEIRMGKTRRDALRTLVARTDVPDVATFVSAVIQADQLGVSIGKVLHIQSDQMRMRRRQRAEELAHQAPIKMIFPMVLLIFPALYVVILGPAVPMIVHGLSGK